MFGGCIFYSKIVSLFIVFSLVWKKFILFFVIFIRLMEGETRGCFVILNSGELWFNFSGMQEEIKAHRRKRGVCSFLTSYSKALESRLFSKSYTYRRQDQGDRKKPNRIRFSLKQLILIKLFLRYLERACIPK